MLQFVRTSVEPLGAAPSAVAEMLKRIELAVGTPCFPENVVAKGSSESIADVFRECGRIAALEHSNIVLKVLSTHFEMDFFSKVDGRIWFHRLHTAGGHTYLAGNLRAWLESCRHMEVRGGFNWPEIPMFLHETFPALFPPLARQPGVSALPPGIGAAGGAIGDLQGGSRRRSAGIQLQNHLRRGCRRRNSALPVPVRYATARTSSRRTPRHRLHPPRGVGILLRRVTRDDRPSIR